MALLKLIWIERDLSKVNEETNEAISIDWDNGRHQRIAINGKTPTAVIHALKQMVSELDLERHHGKI